MSRAFSFKIFFETLVDVTKYTKNPLTTKITIGITCLGIVGHVFYTFKTTNNKIIDVQDKYQFTRNGYTEFMIIDKNGNHYNVNNSLWYWKWDSIEDWHKLQTNKQLIMKYYGWRIPVLGLFPNIIMIDQAKVLESMSSAEFRIIESEYNNEYNDRHNHSSQLTNRKKEELIKQNNIYYHLLKNTKDF